MINIRIGGVPEHFNWPWHRAAERGALAAQGIDLQWRDYPEGSGAMAAALRGGDLDAALLLTEGAVAAIAAKGGFRIASLYTESPLIWGIHVPAGSRLSTVADIRGARYAISRRGSGSHLMAYVHARTEGWPVDALAFVTVNNLEGAIAAFAAGTAEVFFWEKFMTQPLVASGQFRRVGEFVAPWPAFVLCVADAVDLGLRRALARALDWVLGEVNGSIPQPGTAALIGARYSLAAGDVAEWLKVTRWAQRAGITSRDLQAVTAALQALDLVDASFDPATALVALHEAA